MRITQGDERKGPHAGLPRPHGHFLAIGSTLTVEPAASLCAVAAEAGASLVIVNRDPTPYDPVATAVIRDPGCHDAGSPSPELRVEDRFGGRMIGAPARPHDRQAGAAA